MLLGGCFLAWIHWVTQGKISHSEIMTCQFFFYYFYFFRHSSVWILTVMSGERCLSLIFPLQAKTYSTIRMAKIVSTITIAFWLLSDIAWTFAVKTVPKTKQYQNGCKWVKQHDYYMIVNILNNVFYSLLPCILIFLLNTIIICKLLYAKFKSQKSNQTSAVSKSAMSTTLMLLSVSVSFLILTTPVAVNFLVFRANYANPVLGYITTYLYYTNHSCNALMYTLLSPTFRREIKRFFCNTSIDESSTSSTGHGNRVGPSEV